MNIARLLSEKIGNEREQLHRLDKTSRQLTLNTNETGLRGEHAFGEMVGIYPDTSLKRNGDNGVDFILPLLFTVDVKTRKERIPAMRDPFLLIEPSKLNADIYVQMVLSPDLNQCECKGWVWNSEVRTFPVGDLGTGVKNHQIPESKLRSIEALTRRIQKWRLL